MLQLVFPDKCVSYNTFLNDLATVLVPKIKEALQESSDVVSQNAAYRQFGKGNVTRWLKQRRLEPVSKRPGKIEYRISDLRLLQQRKQDYF